MRIGIDARMYGPEQGGLGRYIEQLVLQLEQIDDHNEYIIFLRQNNWGRLTLLPASHRGEDDLVSPSVRGIGRGGAKITKLRVDIPWYGWREQLQLPKIIKQNKIDLIHFPHWNVPLLYNDPFVVTIHDLLLLHYPTREASALGPLTYWFKNWAFKKVLRHAVSQAQRIIVPSEFTRQDINKTLGVSLDKMSVTYLAPTPHDETREAQKIFINERPQDASRPYVLYVGVAYPHKNLNQLLEAWRLFCQKHGNGYQLVLAGKQNYFYNKLLRGDIANALFKNHTLIYTGYLNDTDLKDIYSRASLYVFPSLYEGFGLPPLEAMQYGVPVISSNATCLPEILQDAAHYFDPNSREDMAEAIYRGLNDTKMRDTLTANAKKLLSSYAWDKTARETLEIYHHTKTNRTKTSYRLDKNVV